ncbi:MAG: endonuclease [Chitinophagales bacterium]|nr:endonuclease [Chitinophagales bacterium]
MEGPSIVILKEEVQCFKGKKILEVHGNTSTDKERLLGERVTDFKSWGKHFIICFPHFFVRIHFLMFGSYRINEEKETVPRLSLQFKNGILNLYTCSVKIIDEDVNKVYSWKSDVMSPQWDAASTTRSLKLFPDAMICDVLLNQDIFSGVGNIIKNEVLFRVKIHPETHIKFLSNKQIKEIVKDVREYCFLFYEWKKVYQLRKHWQIYKKKKCFSCCGAVTMKHTGIGRRRSFFCTTCQILA